MKITILGRTDFDFALAKTFASVGISVSDSDLSSDIILRRDKGKGVIISQDASVMSNLYVPYGADTLLDVKQDDALKTSICYFGPHKREIEKLAGVPSPYRTCLFMDEKDRWVEGWCGSYEEVIPYYQNLVANTKVVISHKDSMPARMASYLGVYNNTKIDLDEISYVLKIGINPIRVTDNTMFDRAIQILTRLCKNSPFIKMLELKRDIINARNNSR